MKDHSCLDLGYWFLWWWICSQIVERPKLRCAGHSASVKAFLAQNSFQTVSLRILISCENCLLMAVCKKSLNYSIFTRTVKGRLVEQLIAHIGWFCRDWCFRATGFYQLHVRLLEKWIHEYALKRLMDVIKVMCCCTLSYRLHNLGLESWLHTAAYSFDV